MAPAMTLKRMYHCVPIAMRNTLPKLIGDPGEEKEGDHDGETSC